MDIARASGYEVRSLLELGHDIGYVGSVDYEVIGSQVDMLIGEVTALARYLRKGEKSAGR